MNTCSICQGKYAGHGNNAQPVNDGRCCGDCNLTVVVPARMRWHGNRISAEEKPNHK